MIGLFRSLLDVLLVDVGEQGRGDEAGHVLDEEFALPDGLVYLEEEDVTVGQGASAGGEVDGAEVVVAGLRVADNMAERVLDAGGGDAEGQDAGVLRVDGDDGCGRLIQFHGWLLLRVKVVDSGRGDPSARLNGTKHWAILSSVFVQDRKR